MKTISYVGFAALLIATLSGLSRQAAAQTQTIQLRPAASAAGQRSPAVKNEEESRIQANLGRLSPEDQQIAKEQGYCPIMTKNRLGIMGAPVKVMVKGQAVFLCCKGCAAKAQANPDQTLANVEASKARTAQAEIDASLSKLGPEDRKLAEAQGYCPIMTDNRLGVMGPPIKVMIGNQPVFLCCKGCRTRASADPNRTLATVDKLKARVSQEAARRATAGQPAGTQRQ